MPTKKPAPTPPARQATARTVEREAPRVEAAPKPVLREAAPVPAFTVNGKAFPLASQPVPVGHKRIARLAGMPWDSKVTLDGKPLVGRVEVKDGMRFAVGPA